MKRAETTYGQLDRVLKALGFTRRLVAKEPPAVRYEHAKTGALISFTPFTDDETVLDHHVTVVRATLDNFGIADGRAFASELQKAG